MRARLRAGRQALHAVRPAPRREALERPRDRPCRAPACGAARPRDGARARAARRRCGRARGRRARRAARGAGSAARSSPSAAAPAGRRSRADARSRTARRSARGRRAGCRTATARSCARPERGPAGARGPRARPATRRAGRRRVTRLEAAGGDELGQRRRQSPVAAAQEMRAHVAGARDAEHPRRAQRRLALGARVVEVAPRRRPPRRPRAGSARRRPTRARRRSAARRRRGP